MAERSSIDHATQWFARLPLSVDDEEYNPALSQRRVCGVKNYLFDKHGIDADHIVDLWFGEFNPIADNATSEGR